MAKLCLFRTLTDKKLQASLGAPTSKPHAVGRATFMYPYRDGHKDYFSYSYDPSGNLVNRFEEQNKQNRDLKWHPDNRLRDVVDRDVSETYLVYNADGERVRKNGQYGETVYVNQFFSIRNTVISSKHFFAGNTRIATKLTQIGEREALTYMDADTETRPETISDVLGGDIKITGSGKYLHQPKGKAKGYDKTDKGSSLKGKRKGKAYAYGRDKEPKGHAYGKYKDKKGKALGRDKERARKKELIDSRRSEHAKKLFDKQHRKKRDRVERESKGKGKGVEKDKGEAKGKGYGKEKTGKGKAKKCQGRGKGLSDDCDDYDLRGQREKNKKRGLGPVKAKGKAYAYGFYWNRGEEPPYSDDGTKWPKDKEGKAFGRGSGIFKSAEWQLFYYHYDHLGSTSLNTDVKGEVYEKTLYFPFGEIWREEGIDVEKDLLGFKFTAKELDIETGYYYFGARYYEPVLSRWLSADPAIKDYLPSYAQLFFPDKKFDPEKELAGEGGIYNAKNLNLYSYVHSNP